MRLSRLIPGLVPIAVLAVACTDDLPTNPAAVDSSLLVTAQAGKAVGQDGGSVFEPGRIIQEAAWAPGFVKDFNKPTSEYTYRACQLNSYEDLDGNDFVSTAPSGAYRHESVKEHDGFVLVYEGSSPSSVAEAYAQRHLAYIGRAAWNATVWIDNASGDLISMNSLAQGVVAPIDFGNPDTQELMNWFNNPEAGDAAGWGLGSYRWISAASYEAWMGPIFLTDPANGTVMVGGGQGIGYDLLNDPLGIIPVHPNPALEGTVGRAVSKLDNLLADYEGQGQLIGVECDWQQNGTWVTENRISYTTTWPKQLNGLF